MAWVTWWCIEFNIWSTLYIVNLVSLFLVRRLGFSDSRIRRVCEHSYMAERIRVSLRLKIFIELEIRVRNTPRPFIVLGIQSRCSVVILNWNLAIVGMATPNQFKLKKKLSKNIFLLVSINNRQIKQNKSVPKSIL